MKSKLIISILFVWATSVALAQNDVKEHLLRLAKDADQYYVTDDYERLYACINQYEKLLEANKKKIGADSTLYQAYYNKMYGS